MKTKLWGLMLGISFISLISFAASGQRRNSSVSSAKTQQAQLNSVEESQELLEQDEIRKANRLNQQAIEFVRQGKYAKAEPLYQEALAIYK